jgi:hypothetical protein
MGCDSNDRRVRRQRAERVRDEFDKIEREVMKFVLSNMTVPEPLQERSIELYKILYSRGGLLSGRG